MEATIILTQDEIEVTKQHLNGEFGAFTATPHQIKHIMAVTEKAEALMDKLDAYDELDGDLIQWFWDKYQKQQSEINA